jgi:hypothetical protein
MSPEQQSKRTRAIRAINTLGRLGLHGMTLQLSKLDPPKLDPPPAPRPIVYRCACGKPISLNRNRCYACKQQLLIDLGEQVLTQELLDAVLSRNADISLEELRPHLQFTPTEKGTT